jgi:hypothetical protein
MEREGLQYAVTSTARIISFRVSYGSFFAARRKILGVRCVPFSAPYDTILSVSYIGEIRRSELNFQSRESETDFTKNA